MKLDARIERHPLREAFTLARGAKREAVVVVVELRDGPHRGRGGMMGAGAGTVRTFATFVAGTSQLWGDPGRSPAAAIPSGRRSGKLPAVSVRAYPVAKLAELPPGTRVQVVGTAHSTDPVDSPHGGPALLGYSISCSVFGGRPGLPEFEGTRHVVQWSDAVLEDATGSVDLALDASVIRAPAGDERHLDDAEAMQRVLRTLGLELPPPIQLQLLERSVRDGVAVTVTGTVDVATEGKGAFRSSARPRVVLRGNRAAPLVLVPR